MASIIMELQGRIQYPQRGARLAMWNEKAREGYLSEADVASLFHARPQVEAVCAISDRGHTPPKGSDFVAIDGSECRLRAVIAALRPIYLKQCAEERLERAKHVSMKRGRVMTRAQTRAKRRRAERNDTASTCVCPC